jgi:AcrB/AcrD/AcrF family
MRSGHRADHGRQHEKRPAQVALLVLVRISAKRVIRIVEFARDLEREGSALIEATVRAGRLRFQLITITTLAFIMSVAVCSGRSGVTAFSLFLTSAYARDAETYDRIENQGRCVTPFLSGLLWQGLL